MAPTLVLLAALAQLPPASVADPVEKEAVEVVELATNAQRVVAFRDLRRVFVGNDAVIEVRQLGADQVLVIGIAEGNSSLTLVDGAGGRREYRLKVRTVEWANDVIRRLLEPLYDTSPRFRVRLIGDRYYLDGLISTVEDYDRVRALLEAYPSLIFLARLDPRALEAKAAQIGEELARAGLPSVRATVVGQSLLLEGEVRDELELRKAVAIAEALFRPLKVLPAAAPQP